MYNQMTPEKAIEFVQKRGFAYWKLYKGNKRVSQCDEVENPDGDVTLAVALFEEELNSRNAGNYEVNVYKKLKGDSGGHRFEFSIKEFQTNSNMNSSQNMDLIIDSIKNQVETKALLNEIKSMLIQSLDNDRAIAEFLQSQFNEDDSDDMKGVERLGRVINTLRSFGGSGATSPTSIPELPKSFTPKSTTGNIFS